MSSKTGIDWEKDLKNSMWQMFWICREHGDATADEEFLKENVARLIRMTSQKTAGQRRGHNDHVDWNAFTPTLMNIALAATAMCLDGRFGEMPRYID